MAMNEIGGFIILGCVMWGDGSERRGEDPVPGRGGCVFGIHPLFPKIFWCIWDYGLGYYGG